MRIIKSISEVEHGKREHNLFVLVLLLLELELNILFNFGKLLAGNNDSNVLVDDKLSLLLFVIESLFIISELTLAFDEDILL
jgi:hypothetical protein